MSRCTPPRVQPEPSVEEPMSARSAINSFILAGAVTTAIATLGLGSPAFAGGGIRPSTPEIRGHHITTRTGGTLDSHPRREPHAPHQGSSLQGLEMTGSGADHGNPLALHQDFAVTACLAWRSTTKTAWLFQNKICGVEERPHVEPSERDR
jgi:hypothetical protein